MATPTKTPASPKKAPAKAAKPKVRDKAQPKAKSPGKAPKPKVYAKPPAIPEGEKHPPHRPTIYTEKLVRSVLDLLAEGVPLRKVCAMDGMPSWSLWYRWMLENEVLFSRYMRARQIGCVAMLEEAVDIADESSNDTIETEFGPAPDKEWIARSKLRVDTRFRIVERFFPQEVKHEHTGPNGQPIQHQHQTQVVMVPPKEVAVIEQRALPPPEPL